MYVQTIQKEFFELVYIVQYHCNVYMFQFFPLQHQYLYILYIFLIFHNAMFSLTTPKKHIKYTSTKEIFLISRISSKYFTKYIFKVGISKYIFLRISLIKSSMSKLIILFSFIIIRKNSISFRYFFKFLFCALIFAYIRM